MGPAPRFLVDHFRQTALGEPDLASSFLSITISKTDLRPDLSFLCVADDADKDNLIPGIISEFITERHSCISYVSTDVSLESAHSSINFDELETSR